MQGIYRPYHRALERLVAECVRRFGRCLIVDGHSFPAAALPYELDRGAPRPDICLGTVATGQSPEPLVALVERTVRDHGFSVGRNTPFGGAIMPSRFAGDPTVATIMIETNRRLYLDERTAEKTGGFARTVALMEALAERVREWLARA